MIQRTVHPIFSDASRESSRATSRPSSRPGRHRASRTPQRPAARPTALAHARHAATPARARGAGWLSAAVAAAMSAAVLAGPPLQSGAWFVDTTTSDTGQVATGYVDLVATPSTAAFSITGLTPGDSGYGLITVRNSGPLSYRYAATQSASGSLPAAQLNIEVKAQTNATSCNATSYAGNGSVVRSTTSMATSTVFGNPATGAHTGDRTVAAGATEYLCVRLTLPTSAPSSTQGSTLTSVFTFSAEQTTNN